MYCQPKARASHKNTKKKKINLSRLKARHGIATLHVYNVYTIT